MRKFVTVNKNRWAKTKHHSFSQCHPPARVLLVHWVQICWSLGIGLGKLNPLLHKNRSEWRQCQTERETECNELTILLISGNLSAPSVSKKLAISLQQITNHRSESFSFTAVRLKSCAVQFFFFYAQTHFICLPPGSGSKKSTHWRIKRQDIQAVNQKQQSPWDWYPQLYSSPLSLCTHTNKQGYMPEQREYQQLRCLTRC